jgi:hypothetical protein
MIAMGPNIKRTGGACWDFWDHDLPLTEKFLGETLDKPGLQIKTRPPFFLPYTMASKKLAPTFLFKAQLKAPNCLALFRTTVPLCGGTSPSANLDRRHPGHASCY